MARTLQCYFLCSIHPNVLLKRILTLRTCYKSIGGPLVRLGFSATKIEEISSISSISLRFWVREMVSTRLINRGACPATLFFTLNTSCYFTKNRTDIAHLPKVDRMLANPSWGGRIPKSKKNLRFFDIFFDFGNLRKPNEKLKISSCAMKPPRTNPSPGL